MFHFPQGAVSALWDSGGSAQMWGLSHCPGSYKQMALQSRNQGYPLDSPRKTHWPRWLRMSYIMRSLNEGTRMYLHEENDQPEDWVLDCDSLQGLQRTWLCKWSGVGRAASPLRLPWLGLTQHVLFGLELDSSMWQMLEQIFTSYLCCLWLWNESEAKSQTSNRHFTLILSPFDILNYINYLSSSFPIQNTYTLAAKMVSWLLFHCQFPEQTGTC